MKIIRRFVNTLKIGAGICLLGMVFLTGADVVGGHFGHPILGSEELVSLLGCLLIAFSLPFAHMEKSHIGVEMLYLLMPRRVKLLLDITIKLACTGFFSLAAWQSYLYAAEMKKVGQVSPTIQLPVHYIIYGVFFGCLVLSIVIFAEFFSYFGRIKDE